MTRGSGDVMRLPSSIGLSNFFQSPSTLKHLFRGDID